GSVSKLPGLPPGSRAAQMVDSSVPVPGGFLELFGRPPRESSCECERTSQMLLPSIISLVSGPVLADALRDPGNRINQLAASAMDDAKLVEQIYVSILCRKPNAKELALGLDTLKGNEDEYAKLVEVGKKRQDDLAAYEKRLPQIVARFEEDFKRLPTWTVLD